MIENVLAVIPRSVRQGEQLLELHEQRLPQDQVLGIPARLLAQELAEMELR